MHLTENGPWFRVFFADGRGIAVEGERELARILARKSPRAIYHEPAVIYRCQHCGIEGPWTSSWRWWCVLAHHPAHIQAKAGCTPGTDGHYIACSLDHFGELVEHAFAPPRWVRCADEPREGERASALYMAIRDERQRRSDAKEYRKVPMPEWLGQGHCKWCNGPMTEADKPRLMWHAACAREWELHALLPAQLAYLVKRDGRTCATPGCDRPGCEVDHRRPLWSVRHLPAMLRRAFHGPANLHLLCVEHHQEKTKREAAQRAALKRNSPLDDPPASEDMPLG